MLVKKNLQTEKLELLKNIDVKGNKQKYLRQLFQVLLASDTFQKSTKTPMKWQGDNESLVDALLKFKIVNCKSF